MKKISFLLLFLFSRLLIAAQEIHVSSIQHITRWVSQSNFPSYIMDLRIQEEMLNATAEALKRKFKADTVILPVVIENHYISGFGKASLKKPVNNNKGYNVSVLSWITRATAGFAVLWKMEVMVHQNGKNIFSNKTEHELEYFNASGYLTSKAWMNDEEFALLYKDLINEVLELSDPLPAKLVIGSIEEKEKEAKSYLNHPTQHLLKTKGNFLAAGNFVMKLEKDQQDFTLAYIDGSEMASSNNSMSELGAKLLASLTKLNIGYNARTKQRRFGKMEYEDGKKLKLRMEWVELTKKYTDGSSEPGTAISPIVIDVYDKNELVGYFTFFSKISSVVEEKSMGFKIDVPQPIFILEGMLYDNPIEIEYEPINEFVVVSQNKEPRVVVIMNNINPDNHSFSNTKLSKNKVSISSSSQSIFSKKPKFVNLEWYPVFADESVSDASLKTYSEAILLMFFAIGNQ
jgi:hypothetical protein